ncbi:MAG: helix-turn-helix domain-containing protein [Myxococcota bacterium]|jgi:AcrR family transcriptional regulator|nr:helix-turn-helix domain-containing protein [Myxococcota bacterium]
MPIRERQRQQTRDVILEVALSEIAEHGLAGVRIEHIARKSGVTRPTVYAHFPTREDFLRELQTRSEANALAQLQNRLGRDESRTGVDLFHELVDGLFDMLATTNDNLRRESFALMLREPRPERWLGNDLFGFIAQRLAASQAHDPRTTDRDPEDLTRIAMTALFPFIVIEGSSSEERRRDAHQLLDWLFDSAIPAEETTR